MENLQAELCYFCDFPLTMLEQWTKNIYINADYDWLVKVWLKIRIENSLKFWGLFSCIDVCIRATNCNPEISLTHVSWFTCCCPFLERSTGIHALVTFRLDYCSALLWGAALWRLCGHFKLFRIQLSGPASTQRASPASSLFPSRIEKADWTYKIQNYLDQATWITTCSHLKVPSDSDLHWILVPEYSAVWKNDEWLPETGISL